MNNGELQRLITEGEELIGKLRGIGIQLDQYENEHPLEYEFQDSNHDRKYNLWVKKSILYLTTYYKDYHLTNEFIQKSKQQLWDTTFRDMIDILNTYDTSDYSNETLEQVERLSQRNVNNKKVFIVHGHDSGTKETVARFLEKLGIKAVILSEQPNQGSTIIEKIEKHTDDVGFVIVLYTPCDLGAKKDDAGSWKKRARQNVVFEHGYLIGKLGRERVCHLLSEEDIEIPGDLSGTVYIDKNADWKTKITREMKELGYNLP